MAGILDVCVPSRRRERRRQRQQTKEHLHSRFGDVAISAPNEGGWNQPYTDGHADRDWPIRASHFHGSPDTDRTLVDSSPELDPDFDKVIVIDDSYATPLQKERNAITITIPLPWSSKRSHSRSSSGMTHPTVVELPKRDELERSPPPTAPSPPIIYKPASEAYAQELAKLGVYQSPSIGPWNFAHSPSPPPIDIGRANVSPVTMLSPVCEDFVKGLGDLGMCPSPAPTAFSASAPSQRKGSPPLHVIEKYSRARLPSPPCTSVQFEAAGALSSNPPDTNRPVTASSIRQIAAQQPDAAMSTYDPIERPSTAKSMRPEYVNHSASQGASEMRLGTTRARSSSRGPGLDRTGYMRSSSREPVGRRRAESREPVGRRRAESREPVGRRRAESHEPIGRRRAESHEPIGRRRAESHESIECSAESYEPSYDHRPSSRGPGPIIPPPSRARSVEPHGHHASVRDDPLFPSYTSNDHASANVSFAADDEPPGLVPDRKHSTATTASNSSGVGHSRGYYGSVRNDYKHLALVGDLFSENETDSGVSTLGRGASSTSSTSTSTKAKFEKLKDRMKSPFLGGTEMVPDGDELWS